MNKINANRLVTVSLTTVIIGLLAQQLQAAPTPPGPDVRVVNTQTNPVPVSVINFPTGTNTVNVSSSTNAPLLVRNVDSGPAQPVQVAGLLTIGAGQFAVLENFYSVPDGKRLVVECISALGTAPSGQNLVNIELQVIEAVPAAQFPRLLADPHFTGNGAGGEARFQSSQLVKGYVGVGGKLQAHTERNADTGIAFVLVTMSGYLVDVP